MEQQYLETEEMWFANWDMGGAYWDKNNDNGTSADERRLSGETGDGIGIKNIKERVAAIGGTI